MPKFFEFVSTVRKRSVDLFTKPSGMTEWQLFAHHCRPPSVITSRGIVSLPNRERAVSRLRTVAIAPGKVAEAVGFAHQVAKHAEKITGLKVGVSMPIGGNPFRIAWVAAEPNLASVETNNNKLMSDPEYMKLVESSAGD